MVVSQSLGSNRINFALNNEVSLSIWRYFNHPRRSEGCTGMLRGELKGRTNQKGLDLDKSGMLNQVVFNVLMNPNPLKDDEASALLDAAVLV